MAGRLTGAGALLISAIAAGCSFDRDAGPAVVARDTVIAHSGADVTVRIVESTADTVSVSMWRVDETPELDVGADDSEATSLHRVSGAYRLADGRVVVADGGSTQLKVFDTAGGLIGAVGGAGGGPGEFRNMTWFGRLPGDSLVVWDFGQTRVTVFDPTVTRAREFRNTTRSSISGVFADGSLLSRGFVDLGGRQPSGLERHVSAALHLTPDGTIADSLGAIPGGEGFFIAGDGWFSVFTPPFARATEVVAAGDRLHVGDSERPEIRVLSPDGTPLMLVRWTHTPRAIGPAEIERAKQQMFAASHGDNDRANMERMFREMPMPQAMPAFSRLRVDRDANLWVQHYRTAWDQGPSQWLVFGSDGGLVAQVELPGALVPTDIGPDYVLGIERDELDVEHVRLYRLHRSS